MRSVSRDKSSPYEVRCARCDVSFPVETRTCIHCGGPTGEAGAFLVMDDPSGLVPGDPVGTRPSSIEPEANAESPFGALGERVFGGGAQAGAPTREDGGADPTLAGEHGPPGIVQRLMQSMGSVIWIAILIAFSLSRSCENG